MKVYKVEYYTLCRGRKASDPVGNIRQSSEIAYIECDNTSEIEVLLDKHYEKPHPCGSFYSPVVEIITTIDGHCIRKEEKPCDT